MVKGSTYCTYFDKAYLARGRVMVDSLRAQRDFQPIVVLALDDATYDEVRTWEHLNVHARRLQTLEQRYPELASARADRSRIEYIFTLTPWLIKWILEEAEAGAWVTYLDADLAFFSDTAPIYEMLLDSSIAIVEHRFTWEQSWRSKYGRFNVGWVGFRNDRDGRSCLNWWAQECIAWCRDEVGDNRFADQGYLDQFPNKFSGLRIIDHPGVNVAPWNLRRHNISGDPSSGVSADNRPLIFFHFHGLQSQGNRYFFKHLPYLARTTPTIRDLIYRPYCLALSVAISEMDEKEPTPLQRRTTFLSFIGVSHKAVLQQLGVLRGDYLDLSTD